MFSQSQAKKSCLTFFKYTYICGQLGKSEECGWKREERKCGRKSIARDFKDIDKNLEQIYENITESNIVVQSIKTALNDENDLGLKGAVKQYVKLDKQTAQVLASAVNEINGATNLTPEQLQETFNQVAQIYNENGQALSGLEIANVEGNIAGLSYVDASGKKQTVTINLSNVDITKPKEIAKAIAHETTKIASHKASEGNALSRGNMASAIMGMKNYGNENTNKLTSEQWLADNAGSGILLKGNEGLRNNITSAINNDGSMSGFFRETGIAAISAALYVAGKGKQEVSVKGEGENTFATAGDAIYGLAGLNQTAKDNLEKEVKNAVHGADEYKKLSSAVDNTIYAMVRNPSATLSALGGMPLTILDGLNRNPVETILMAEGYRYAKSEYEQGYYLTAGAALLGSLALDSPVGTGAKQIGKTVVKEAVETAGTKTASELTVKKTAKETAEKAGKEILELGTYGSSLGMVGERVKINNVSLEDYKIIKVYEGTEKNASMFLKGYTQDPSTPNKFVFDLEAVKDVKLARVYDGKISNLYGNYVMKFEDVLGKSPATIKNKFALQASPKYLGVVDIKAGSKLSLSEVNKNFGGSGGKMQFDFMGERIGEFNKIGGLE